MASYPIRAAWFKWPGDYTAPPLVAVPASAGVVEATFVASLPPLVAGTKTTSIHATIPAGSVISCTPASGTMVAPGTAVAYVVSTGPVARSAKKE